MLQDKVRIIRGYVVLGCRIVRPIKRPLQTIGCSGRLTTVNLFRS